MGIGTLAAVAGAFVIMAWSAGAIRRELRRPGGPDRDALLLDGGIIATVSVVPLALVVMERFPLAGAWDA
jgi:hypothetical protein